MERQDHTQQLWNRFYETGRISDYLLIKHEIRQHSQEMAMEDDISAACNGRDSHPGGENR